MIKIMFIKRIMAIFLLLKVEYAALYIRLFESVLC